MGGKKGNGGKIKEGWEWGYYRKTKHDVVSLRTLAGNFVGELAFGGRL